MADQRRPLISSPTSPSDSASNTPALPSLGFTHQSHSLGFTANPNVSPPQSPPRSRPGYSRLGSETTIANTPETVQEEDEEGIEDTLGRKGSGLGFAGPASPTSPHPPRRVSIQSIPRVAVGAKITRNRSPSITSTPNTGDPLKGGFPKDSPDSTPDLRRDRAGFSPTDQTDYEQYRRGVLKNGRSSEASLRSGGDDYSRYLHNEDTDRLRRGTPSIKSAYETSFRPTEECPTSRDFYISRWSWLSVTIVILCLFSTVFSGIFLGLAWKGPRYGKQITTHGALKPSNAILLTSIMAKLIELSFVTSFVAFLGQVLSRRAFMKEQGRGITLAEMSMWRWIVQPGTLITHYQTAKYAGATVLGIMSLLSATLATLYSPAAQALVQPQLKFGSWDRMLLAANVKTSFANINYVHATCESPISTDDEENKGATCLQIEHAAQGYHNYQRYLANWAAVANSGNGTTDQKTRPPGFGLLYENTTITASWVQVQDDLSADYRKFGRVVNNVSLAMPHAGVFQAARDSRNGIIQPEELDGLGIYSIRASVPSPVMHVLCANMNKSELAPIVYTEWNNATVDINSWVQQQQTITPKDMNSTVVDDLFGWNRSDPTNLHNPPIFARYPGPFNTIMNHSSSPWGRDSIYILGAGGNDSVTRLGEYVLCQIKVSQTPDCSTQYNATGGGGTMEAVCEEDHNDMAYISSVTNATNGATLPDWLAIGFDWSNSLSLNTGIMDGDASNSRLFTQLMLQETKDADGDKTVDLSKDLPSPAEALAVMSGCTLLMSAQDAPFVEFWNYTVPNSILATPQTQYFNASIRAQQFASGGTDTASRAFLIVLLLVFLMDIFVLIYFLLHRGLVTDFSEPPNLFTLAVNSPPSHLLAGSCGGGPEGKQYTVNWFVNAEGDHLYMEPGARPIEKSPAYTTATAHGHPHIHTHIHSRGPSPRVSAHSAPPGSGVGGGGAVFDAISKGIDRLRDRGGLGFGRKKDQQLLRPVSVIEQEDGDVELEEAPGSRFSRQYNKLAKRRSML